MKKLSTTNAKHQGEFQGLVIERKGPVLTVESSNGTIVDCEGHGPGKKAVVGDMVSYDTAATDLAQGVITQIHPRKNSLIRADALHRKPQTIAANIDRIYIVVALEPPMREGLIDRYLVCAHAQGLEASIIYNKVDLIDDDELYEEIRENLQCYVDLGYPLFYVSAETGAGLDDLRKTLDGERSIFVGHSGVGKTSLLNALDPGLGRKVQDLSAASGRGQHTTSASALFHLPSGGDVIDSPGIRSLGIWQLDPDTLRDHFIEFADYAPGCRFNNCRHLEEPGCAVKAALDRCEIAQHRYDHYVSIRNSLIDIEQGSAQDFFD